MAYYEKEVWKKIDLPGIKKDYYEISSYGKIRNPKGKLLSPYKDKNGYLRYTIYTEDGKRKHFMAHRLVALYFVPNPENKPEVNHKKPLMKDDLYYKNFEWVTPEENRAHSQRLKRQDPITCDRHGRATLKNKDVKRICELMSLGKSNKEICDIFGFEKKSKSRERFRGVLKHIRNRKTWKEISCSYRF